jgi:4-hydroxy-tetrahydrodipicolinate synthase
MLAPLAGVAPKLVRRLYDSCRAGKLFEARPAQEEIATLRQAMKPGGAPELKAALRHMGRDCGDPRPPLLPLDPPANKALADALGRGLAAEPHGW